jgi:hypothetical protein
MVYVVMLASGWPSAHAQSLYPPSLVRVYGTA